MSALDIFKVNLDTPQPNGRLGESPRSAFTKYNAALDEISKLVDVVSSSAPNPAVPYMTWLDTSVSPAMIRRRNASNNGWVVIGPALDFVYSRSNILGTVSQSGGVPTGSIIERGSNSNGEYVKFADGTQMCSAYIRVPMSLVTASVLASAPVLFAAGFLPESKPAVSLTASPQNTDTANLRAALFSNYLGTPTAAYFRVSVVLTNVAAGNYTFTMIAIGRWK